MIGSLLLASLLGTLAVYFARQSRNWKRRADHWFERATRAEHDVDRLRLMVPLHATSYAYVSQLMPTVVEVRE